MPLVFTGSMAHHSAGRSAVSLTYVTTCHIKAMVVITCQLSGVPALPLSGAGQPASRPAQATWPSRRGRGKRVVVLAAEDQPYRDGQRSAAAFVRRRPGPTHFHNANRKKPAMLSTLEIDSPSPPPIPVTRIHDADSE